VGSGRDLINTRVRCENRLPLRQDPLAELGEQGVTPSLPQASGWVGDLEASPGPRGQGAVESGGSCRRSPLQVEAGRGGSSGGKKTGTHGLLPPVFLVRNAELGEAARQQVNLERRGPAAVGKAATSPQAWEPAGVRHPLSPWAPLKPTSPSCERSPAKNGAEQIFLK